MEGEGSLFWGFVIMLSRKFLAFVAFSNLLLWSVIPLQAAMYSVQDLGLFGADSFNENGQVAGSIATDIPNMSHAALYSNGVITDLGTLGGDNSVARAINNLGQIVGFSTLTADGIQHGFLYNDGIMSDLGTFGGSLSDARDINDSGAIVGSTRIAGYVRAYLYEGGAMTDLGTLGGQTAAANAITKNGDIVGGAALADGTSHAFLYSNGQMTDLGSIGGNSYATAINSKGQVVGLTTVPSGHAVAYLYSDGIMTSLGANTLDAIGINDAGQVVGTAEFGNQFPNLHTAAYIYDKGQLTELNTLIDPNLKIYLSGAADINNSGQVICGGAYFGRAGGHTFLLTPIPEPASLTLLALGCFSLLFWHFHSHFRWNS
jgi:probable HAF family extracellular repeat protein